jgi:hypothetical protein
MKKLLKQPVESSAFVRRIVAGQFDYLGGLPTFSAGPESMLLHFVGSWLKRSAGQMPTELLESLVSPLPFVRVAMIPSVLEPFMIGLSRGFVTEFTGSNVVSDLLELLPDVDMTDDEVSDSVIAILDVISSLLRVFRSIDPDRVLACVARLTAQEETEEEEAKPLAALSLGAAIKFVCEVSVSIGRGDSELLLGFIEMMPFPVESNSNAPVLEALLAMAENEAFQELAFPILNAFKDFLVMPKQTLEQYAIGGPIKDALREAVKKAIRADPALERKLTMEMTREQQNRFNAVLRD